MPDGKERIELRYQNINHSIEWESVQSLAGRGQFAGFKVRKSPWLVTMYGIGPEWGELSGTVWVTDRRTMRSREVSGLLARIRRRPLRG